ncbi:MAG: hypothetical protein H6606_05925 [Flavobacteriales bacterium]|nr:hypothetical protein [Flavobacteriales bacterium]
MNKSIETKAAKLQDINRQIKELQKIADPLKKELVEFGEANMEMFDDKHRINFKCGSFLSLRVSDRLAGENGKLTEQHIGKIIDHFGDEVTKVSIDTKRVVELVDQEPAAAKTLLKLGLKIEHVPTVAFVN